MQPDVVLELSIGMTILAQGLRDFTGMPDALCL